MGGAQPLAITLNGGVAICVEADADRIERRLQHRYLDVRADDLEHALKLAVDAKGAKRALSIGLLGNAATWSPPWWLGVSMWTWSPTRRRPTTR